MATAYSDRYFVYVPLSFLAPSNASAKAWDPDTGGDQTFGAVRLSATGAEPATHTACNTAATAAMRTAVLAAFTNIPFYRVYREADGWSWESALADAGLQVIQAEIP